MENQEIQTLNFLVDEFGRVIQANHRDNPDHLDSAGTAEITALSENLFFCNNC